MRTFVFMTLLRVAEWAIRGMQWMAENEDRREFSKPLPRGWVIFTLGNEWKVD